MVDTSDAYLLQQCQAGDRDAFGELVRRYQNLVCSVAYSVLGDFSRSEDVGQETFVAAWKQLSDLRDVGKFRSWIAAIVRNLALATLRRERPTSQLSDGSHEASYTEFEESSLKEEEAVVWSTLEDLPENYRVPLVLFYREDQSVADVASALDLSESAVKQRLSRGREMLRREVTSVVERTLRRTVPGTAFTLAVMGALPGIGAASASAAVVGAASKASGPIAAAAVKTGLLGGFLGALGGLGGAWLGSWISQKGARYESERLFIRKMYRHFTILALIWCIPFIAMGFGWRPWQMGRTQYMVALCLYIVGGQAVLFSLGWRQKRKWEELVRTETELKTEMLPENRLTRFMTQWEGRRWTSPVSLLGMPLVQIAFSDPQGGMNYRPGQPRHRQSAKGWIAVGDVAVGVLFAAGSVAVGGIAIGGIAIGGLALGGLGLGIVSVAGLAIGGLCFGGLSLGAIAAGGLAAGWMAMGGVAAAILAAKGGVAFAKNYAVGGVANATHANDLAAQQFIGTSGVFTKLEGVMNSLNGPHAIYIWVGFTLFIIAISVAMVFVGFKRRDETNNAALLSE